MVNLVRLDIRERVNMVIIGEGEGVTTTDIDDICLEVNVVRLD